MELSEDARLLAEQRGAVKEYIHSRHGTKRRLSDTLTGLGTKGEFLHYPNAIRHFTAQRPAHRRVDWHMTTRSPRSIARSDMIALVGLGVMVGTFLMQAAWAFGRGEWFAWFYVFAILCVSGAIIIVFRRTVRKVPE